MGFSLYMAQRCQNYSGKIFSYLGTCECLFLVWIKLPAPALLHVAKIVILNIQYSQRIRLLHAMLALLCEDFALPLLLSWSTSMLLFLSVDWQKHSHYHSDLISYWLLTYENVGVQPRVRSLENNAVTRAVTPVVLSTPRQYNMCESAFKTTILVS